MAGRNDRDPTAGCGKLGGKRYIYLFFDWIISYLDIGCRAHSRPDDWFQIAAKLRFDKAVGKAIGGVLADRRPCSCVAMAGRLAAIIALYNTTVILYRSIKSRVDGHFCRRLPLALNAL
jgi:hypothetical protein